MLGQQEANNDSNTEHGNRILFLQTESREDSEPEPVARIGSLDRENREVRAAHPKIRLEAIRRQQASVRKILGSDDDTERAEEQGIASSAELPRKNRGLDYEQRRSQCGNKSNATQRIS